MAPDRTGAPRREQDEGPFHERRHSAGRAHSGSLRFPGPKGAGMEARRCPGERVTGSSGDVS